MIVECSTCRARMKVDASRHGGKRITIRCARCRQVFKVDVEAPQEPGAGRVLVAHSDKGLCATIGELLSRENIPYDICHEGHEALRVMAARPPAVALVDVALPGLYAFEVVDKVRRRPGLENVGIILLSSVYNKAAYKRSPTSLHGADDYLEKHHISDQLIGKIRRLIGDSASSPAGEPATAGQETARPGRERLEEINTMVRQAEEHEVTSDSAEGSWEKARRLARIIVSDIALYNEERVAEGIREGNFYQLLDSEIQEGRRLFAERVPENIREERDLLQETFEAFIERRRNEMQT